MNNWQDIIYYKYRLKEDYTNLYNKLYNNEDASNDLINLITTLLEKQREEIVEKIENKRKLNDCIVSRKYKRAVPYTCPEAIMICEDIITLIKSHDKTS